MEKRTASGAGFQAKVLLLVTLFSFALFPAEKSFALPSDIHTYAGTGVAGFTYDGAQAAASGLNLPVGVVASADGSMYIVDRTDQRIRKVDSNGVMTTVAGNGSAGYFGDGGQAASASLNNPSAVTFDAAGNMYIADRNNNRIRKVDTSGVIKTVAGTGKGSYSGDGRSAVSAALKYPEGVAVDAYGNIYISDTSNNRIRKIGVDGIIYTVAGTGRAGYSGDGGPATQARINHPESLWIDKSGSLYIADYTNNRIRKVSASGIITTVAGKGTRGFSGDGGPATLASLNYPFGITGDSNGNLYISGGDSRVRKVDASGIITTFAGTGTKGFSGDEGPATSANLNAPAGVALDASGNFYIADKSNNRVRVVEGLAYVLPVSSITSPPDGATISVPDAPIAGSAVSANGISFVEVSTDGGTAWNTANGTTSWSYDWKPKANGTYKLMSRAHDSVGNVQEATASATVTVSMDLTPPVSVISTPAAGSVLTSFANSINGTASDGTGSGVAKVEVSTDGGNTWGQATGTTSWSYAWTAPANGSYAIKVRATDSVGNVETPGTGIGVTVNVVVDTTPPVSSITNLGPGAFMSTTTFTITGSANDGTGTGVAKVEVSADGGTTWAAATGTTSWSYIWNTPSSGTYTIKCRATDKAGNVETPGAGFAVTVDKTAPSSAITSPASGATVKGTSVTVTGTATDGTGMGVVRVEVSTDGGSTWTAATGTTSWSYTWTLPADGKYTVKCRATDKAGNVETPGAGVSVTVDKTASISTITAPTAGSVLSSFNCQISGTASDGTGSGVAKVEISTDGGTTWTAAAGTTSWSYAWTAPANGSYTIKTRATDKAGNVETPGAGVGVTVDKTASISTITAPAAGAVLTSLANSITGTASDGTGSGVAKVEVSTDGGNTWTAAAGTTSWSYAWTAPANGSYTLKTRSTDKAGNVETPGAGVTVSVNVPAPPPPPPPPSGGSQVTLNWDPSTTPGVVGYKLYIGTASGTYTQSVDAGSQTTYSVGNLTSGVVYYFAVTAYDVYGNESWYSNEVSKTAP